MQTHSVGSGGSYLQRLIRFVHNLRCTLFYFISFCNARECKIHYGISHLTTKVSVRTSYFAIKSPPISNSDSSHALAEDG